VDRALLDPEVAEILANYPVVVTTLVAWGDMDANHHVNNVVYFRYMEHARLHYFREMGFSRQQRESSIGPILAWTDCRFRKPLEYPDNVSIGTRIVEIQDDRFTMETIIVSHKLKAIAAQGQQKLVMYDYQNLVKAKMPEGLRERMIAMEKTPPAQPDR
jgi:acyl-CoA thioester hydrolase